MKIVNRIKKSKDFAFTIKKGRTFRNSSFIIHVANTERDYTRVGISVSTKIGNAVVRNRVKRQIRAICGEVVDFTKSLDIVIIAKQHFLDVDYQENKKLLLELLNNIGRISQ